MSGSREDSGSDKEVWCPGRAYHGKSGPNREEEESVVSQFEYLDADGAVQSVPYQSHLLVPRVDLLAVSAFYSPPSNWELYKQPVFAIRQTIKETWLKHEIEDPENEPVYHNADEFEQAGYEFRGRVNDLEFLFVDKHFNSVQAIDGGMSYRHWHEDDDYEKPVVKAGILTLCYREDAKETLEALKRAVVAYFEELRRGHEHE